MRNSFEFIAFAADKAGSGGSSAAASAPAAAPTAPSPSAPAPAAPASAPTKLEKKDEQVADKIGRGRMREIPVAGEIKPIAEKKPTLKSLEKSASDYKPAGVETEEIETDSEAVEETPADDVVAEENEGDEFPPELLQRAKEFGFTEDEARQYSDQTLLTLALDRAEARMSALQQNAQPPQQQEAAQQAEEDFKVSLNPDDFPPEVVKQFEEMNSHYAKQLKELKAEVGRLTGDLNSRRLAEVESQVDAFFDGLGEEAHATFGKGKTRELADKRLQQARMAVIAEANALETGYLSNGRQVPAMKVLLERAYRSLHSENFQKAARKEISDKLAKRANQITARGQAKATTSNAELTDEQREAIAIANADKKLAKYRGS